MKSVALDNHDALKLLAGMAADLAKHEGKIELRVCTTADETEPIRIGRCMVWIEPAESPG